MNKPCCAALVFACIAAPALAESPGASSAEPKVQRTVIEDDGARIEELRVRGQVVRVVVRPKTGGGRVYEILPQHSGRDPSQPQQQAGQRVWNVLSF